ncbi:MAG TPA: hypothetical protein VGU02_13250 [Gaiellaceae bacterium]|nr:hypothetical protein [Gaiellaceae bacterium]
MATVATKLVSVYRKRGVLVLVVSVTSALVSAKAGMPLGFWDGPS